MCVTCCIVSEILSSEAFILQDEEWMHLDKFYRRLHKLAKAQLDRKTAELETIRGMRIYTITYCVHVYQTMYTKMTVMTKFSKKLRLI